MSEITVRMADDSCLFCGLHGDNAGGHLFTGTRQKDGTLISKSGWWCIEHLSGCAVQVCPTCIAKYHLPAVEDKDDKDGCK